MSRDDRIEEDFARWQQALIAAAIFAVDPGRTGGVVLHAPPGVERDCWLGELRKLLAPQTPLRRVPLHINDSRLLGGLDLAATLSAGRPIAERGVLSEAHGGVMLLAMAERVPVAVAAKIAAALDNGEVVIERDGLTLNSPARIGVVALDESIDADEDVAAVLKERLAFHVDLSGLRLRAAEECMFSAAQIAAARLRLPSVRSPASVQEALCAVASDLGIQSLRPVLMCQAVAQVIAALDEREEISEEDAALAARLVLAPRARTLPARSASDDEDNASSSEETESADPPTSAEPPETSANEQTDVAAQEQPSRAANESGESTDQSLDSDQALADVVLTAAVAAIPEGLLAQLKLSSGALAQTRTAGRAGVLRKSFQRGRPAGSVAGEPRGGIRLNVIETLRAAAPWQRLRQREVAVSYPPESASTERIRIRRSDFRINRYKQRSQTTTIFVLDASGSAALNRLAETKGAVELLLGDCYVRRDRVALIAFRGRAAELLLSPTRSLAHAKRSLAGMPGGGGTPLAAGIDAASDLAASLLRCGDAPTIVLLTDGRANIASDGAADRKRAEVDAFAAARRIGLAGLRVLFIDTSPRAQAVAQRLAQEMRATYLSLPYADARVLSAAVKTANASAGSAAAR